MDAEITEEDTKMINKAAAELSKIKLEGDIEKYQKICNLLPYLKSKYLIRPDEEEFFLGEMNEIIKEKRITLAHLPGVDEFTYHME